MDGELEKQLHDHDLRLTRVEVELAGVHKEIKEQRLEIHKNAEISRSIQDKVMDIAQKLSELSGSQKMLLWGLGGFGSFISVMQAYIAFGG